MFYVSKRSNNSDTQNRDSTYLMLSHLCKMLHCCFVNVVKLTLMNDSAVKHMVFNDSRLKC